MAPRVYVRGQLEAVLGRGAAAEAGDEEAGQDQADDADSDADPREHEEEDDADHDYGEGESDHTVRIPTARHVKTSAG